jgi:hypothetical protein
LLFVMRSTMRPSARSLSATMARGRGTLGLVPLVWSLFSAMMLSVR